MKSMGSKHAKTLGSSMTKHNALLLEELEQLETEVAESEQPADESTAAHVLSMPLSEASSTSPGAASQPAARCHHPHLGDALCGKAQQQPAQAANGATLQNLPPTAGSRTTPRSDVKESSASPEQVTIKSHEQHCQPSNDRCAADAAVLAADADCKDNHLTVQASYVLEL